MSLEDAIHRLIFQSCIGCGLMASMFTAFHFLMWPEAVKDVYRNPKDMESKLALCYHLSSALLPIGIFYAVLWYMSKAG